jgi:ornithine cyclodeaminase
VKHGVPLACIDDSELIRRSTAAFSARAAKVLSRKDSSTLLMVGTDRLSPRLIEARSSIFDFDEILIRC